MTAIVEMLFDFVSPNAYLSWKPLRDMLARTGAALEITPVFLGGMHRLTGNQPPMVTFAGVKGKNEYNMLEMRRWVAKHELNRFAMNPHFPMSTITALRLLVIAKAEGREIELIELLNPYAWEKGADIADTAKLSAILTDSDFDGEAMLARTQEQAVKDQLIANTEQAVDRGAFGIPTFFVGGEMYFGKDRLDGVEEELTR